MTPVCPHPLERFLDRGLVGDGRHCGSEPLEAGAELGALQPPEAESDLVAALIPAAVCCTVMAGAVLLLSAHVAPLAAPLRLVLLSAAGAAVYGATLLLGWPQVIRQTWAMLRRPKA